MGLCALGYYLKVCLRSLGKSSCSNKLFQFISESVLMMNLAEIICSMASKATFRHTFEKDAKSSRSQLLFGFGSWKIWKNWFASVMAELKVNSQL